MTQQFEYLFSPIEIGPLTLRNRICFSAHGTLFASEEGLPTERQVYYYGERAKGGAGLIVIGGSFVSRTSDWLPGCNIVSDERAIPGYKRIAAMVHEHGANILSQLDHLGREMSSIKSRQPLLAPSALPDPVELEVPKEMEAEDIEEMIRLFAKGAWVAKEGGLDGVEIMAAQGFLIEEFMSPWSNKRQDEYGGTLENRLRFPLRIFEAVRKEVGKDLVVGLKIVGDEFTPGGLTLQDIQEIVKILAATDHLDYIHVCAGTFYSIEAVVPEMSFPMGFASYLAAGVREVVNIPVMAIKRINDPVLAEKILADGQADLIGMARALIADPELPKKAKEGRLEDIRHCTGINEGCVDRVIKNQLLRCIQNPAVGEEKEWGIGTLKPTKTKKKVMIIGGGPGGLKVAEIVALRGHEAVLYEKGEALGGQVLLITKVASRGDTENVIRYLANQVSRLKVKVNLGCEMTAERVLAEAPEVVVVATGATPVKDGYQSWPDIPELPGIDQDNVISGWDVLAGKAQIGQNVLLLDDHGGAEATMTAEYLADMGKRVEIITRFPYVGMRLGATVFDPQMKRLAERKVICTPFTVVKGISGKKVLCYHVYTQEERKIEGIDTVVLVVGKRPNQGLYLALKGKIKELHRVGDCVAPRGIMEAIHEGDLVGRLI